MQNSQGAFSLWLVLATALGVLLARLPNSQVEMQKTTVLSRHKQAQLATSFQQSIIKNCSTTNGRFLNYIDSNIFALCSSLNIYVKLLEVQQKKQTACAHAVFVS